MAISVCVSKLIHLQQIDSDVIIDQELIYRTELQNPHIISRPGGPPDSILPNYEEIRNTERIDGHCLFDDDEVIESLWPRPPRSVDDLFRRNNMVAEPEEFRAQCRMMPPRVYGYVLLTRKWRECSQNYGITL